MCRLSVCVSVCVCVRMCVSVCESVWCVCAFVCKCVSVCESVWCVCAYVCKGVCVCVSHHNWALVKVAQILTLAHLYCFHHITTSRADTSLAVPPFDRYLHNN